MAYNQFFPQTYQQYGNNMYGQQNPYMMPNQQNFQQQQIPQMQQTPQIQNGGFVSVRSIEEAFNYPVAPGNSITFKDANAPYVYTKTKGFSQLEQPIFEKYRLVKEEDMQQEPKKEPEQDSFDVKGQIASLWEEINSIKGQISSVEPKKKTSTKKEVTEDDAKHE